MELHTQCRSLIWEAVTKIKTTTILKPYCDFSQIFYHGCNIPTNQIAQKEVDKSHINLKIIKLS